MHFSIPVLFVLCSFFTATLSSGIPRTNQLLVRGTELESHGTSGLEERYPKIELCTKLAMRKEWRTLSKGARKNYTDAVLCLRKKPSLYKEIKGAKSRYDDFQALHILQTFVIHSNAQFLGWHRWFTWAYEEALRQECGYQGYQPYWDWTLDSEDISASPLFDGSPYGLSGNGEFIPNRSESIVAFRIPTIDIDIQVPPGTGGGCVTTGPFANATVPFGPIEGPLTSSLLNNPENLAYKPHCLRRDLNPKSAGLSLTSANVEILLQSPNITVFNKMIVQGSSSSSLSVHGGGHFAVGMDMRDTFTSPGDPVFFLHHAQIDRLWTLWQKRDLKKRQYAISGTGTFFNYPPSPEFKLSDKIDMGKLSPGGPRPLHDFMDTCGGTPFCYDYM